MHHLNQRVIPRLPIAVRRLVCFVSIAGALFLGVSNAWAQPASIVGRVVDIAQGPVANADVRAERDGQVLASTRTGPDGRFVLPVPPAAGLVVVAGASGFASTSTRLDGRLSEAALHVVLAPAVFTDTASVTAHRASERWTDAASAPVSVVTGAELRAAAPLVVDDVLRQTPGFTLFRRSSSRIANPTAQGATMRGLGSAGGSRALVLADGVPLNDPFGGWVYWNRIPQAAIDRAEVLRGASSYVYGPNATAGVIQFLTVPTSTPAARVTLDAGSDSTARVSALAAGGKGQIRALASAEIVRTDGFYIIEEGLRGSVDTPAGSDYQAFLARVDWIGHAWSTGVKFNAFSEDRANGTVAQTNDTHAATAVVEAEGPAGGTGGLLKLRGFAGTQRYNQVFSAVAADRDSEAISRTQRVPSTQRGGSVEWSRAWPSVMLVAGGDVLRVEGHSHEQPYVAGQAVGSEVVTGGEQTSMGMFATLSAPIGSRVTVSAAGRTDRWQTTAVDSSRSETAFSPRLSLTWSIDDSWRLLGSVQRGFQAPTLNDLHRGFRIGNVVTQANNALKPERVGGAELAIERGGSQLSARVSGFVMRLDDAVMNVTLSSTPTLITRQRQNAGRVNSRGVEVEMDWRAPRQVSVNGSLAFVHSRLASQGVERWVPQIPRVSGSLAVRAIGPGRFTSSMVFRYGSRQFDDDLNSFTLVPATTVDLAFSYPLNHGISLFGAIENLLNTEVETARTPMRLIGPSRSARVGFRWAL